MKLNRFILTLVAVGLRATMALAIPPAIPYQPHDQSVILYQQASFGVIASGTGPFAYQWRKDGLPIAGATNDQIVINAVRFADAGAYSVIVSNAEDVAMSADANLAVKLPGAGDLDCSSFFCGSLINSGVQSITLQPNGKLLVGGYFSKHISRLHLDGSTDYTFMNGLPGPDGNVFAVAIQGDGKVLIGGEFASVNGMTRNRIARLDVDGTLDVSFQNGLSGADYNIWAVAMQSDAKVLIGGVFTTINGVTRNRVARLNADGTLDTAFQNGFSGADGIVRSIATQPDGKVLIGGNFTSVNGLTRNAIARLNGDGTVDVGFQNGLSGANNQSVTSIAAQSDGKVLVGGGFTAINGVARNRIARLNADGTLDTSFQNGLAGANDYVGSVTVQADGKILIGGYFTTVNGVARNRIARLNANGTLDTGFQNDFPVVDGGADSVAVQNDGKVLFGGSFTGGRNRIARLNADGTLDAGFQHDASGPNTGISSVTVQTGGKILIGGTFTSVNGESRSCIARLNADGTLDSGFQTSACGANSFGVLSISVQGDEKVLIGGFFTAVNGVTRKHIARLNADGTLDTAFQNGLSGADDMVRSIATQPDGKVLIGGSFRTVNGVTRNGCARLNADGTLDTGFQNGIYGPVYSVANQANGKILVGGYFPNNVTYLARLNTNGTPDTSFLNGLSGPNSYVYSVTIQSNGKFLIGGEFTAVNGVTRNRIARLNADGTLDVGFQNGLSLANNAVTSIALQSDGKVLIGGSFTLVNGVTRNHIARLNADGTLDTGFLDSRGGITAGYAVESIAIQSNGEVLIGGTFTSVNGIPAANIARLWGNSPSFIENITCSTAGSSTLTLRLPSNSTNRIQFKTNLTDTSWNDLAGDVIMSGSHSPTNKVDDTVGQSMQRFYRVRQLQ
jgi:uncharacterized delta-60 repeat protein